jgi:hypothetical protein
MLGAKLGEKRLWTGFGTEPSGEWSQKVEVDGAEYTVGVSKGKRVRIAYSAKWGNHWYGFVRDTKGKELWSERVNKSTGAKAMLEYASLITPCGDCGTLCSKASLTRLQGPEWQEWTEARPAVRGLLPERPAMLQRLHYPPQRCSKCLAKKSLQPVEG